MPGENLDVVCDRIHRLTGLKAYTSQGFKDLTYWYYMEHTGIPLNFGIAILLGFLVGAAIAGQTFYSFTLENLRYFGVLKAMGTPNKTLLSMILLQALIVSFIGYGIGVGCTVIFAVLSRNSQLSFNFPWELFAFSAVGVAIISSLTALVSIRKVMHLEPAIVFKS